MSDAADVGGPEPRIDVVEFTAGSGGGHALSSRPPINSVSPWLQ
jgi:hypothetical protein